jgi:hypothetical protein
VNATKIGKAYNRPPPHTHTHTRYWAVIVKGMVIYEQYVINFTAYASRQLGISIILIKTIFKTFRGYGKQIQNDSYTKLILTVAMTLMLLRR